MQNPDPVNKSAEDMIKLFDVIGQTVTVNRNLSPKYTFKNQLLTWLNIILIIYTIAGDHGQDYLPLDACRLFPANSPYGIL